MGAVVILIEVLATIEHTKAQINFGKGGQYLGAV